ncbi:MAG: N-acetylglucosamine-6-phosphate deacetylase [Oscillospiraceae bacterium]|nr:N-acetylglucosamine-6-phosphate deacetylase [Oscillospiraceae bacterium]
MIIKNGLVFDGEKFVEKDLYIDGGKIVSQPCGEEFDAEGRYVMPGFIDIHIHGAFSYDFSDAKVEDNKKMLELLAKQGVTSVLPTIMSGPWETMCAGVNALKETNHPAILGASSEGPFINPNKCGAQPKEWLTLPNWEQVESMENRDFVKLMTIAPELEGGLEFTKKATDAGIKISIGHCETDYATGCAAFEAGADHVTHIFNAMPAFNQREPGVAGAAMMHSAYCDIISDGAHLHPAVVKAAFRLTDNPIMVSDCMRAHGMEPGVYMLGGQKVTVEDGKAKLDNGSLAGSTSTVAECAIKAASFGVPLEKLVRALTHTPAESIGMLGKVGCLCVGADADVVIADKDMNVYHVWAKGEKVK